MSERAVSEHQISAAKRARKKSRGIAKSLTEVSNLRIDEDAGHFVTCVLAPLTDEQESYLRRALAVEEGLPLKSADFLARQVAPRDARFIYKFVPSATLARRRQQAKKEPKKAVLSTEESARVIRVARVFDRALAVWKDEGSARDFLNTPHMLLDNRTPMDVALKTDEGARVVEEVLGKLEYGTAL